MEKALARNKRLIAAKGKTKKSAKLIAKPSTKRENLKPKLTPEVLKAFRVELMAKARAAKKGE